MLLLLAEKDDHSTDLIEEWLEYYDADYLRFNGEDVVESFKFSFENDVEVFRFVVSETEVDLNQFSTVFLRRSHLTYSAKIKSIKLDNDVVDIPQYLSNEWEEFASFFYECVKSKISRCYGNNLKINKLKLLLMARKIGIGIPNSYLTDKKVGIPRDRTLITKAIKDNLSIRNNDKMFINYTSLLDNYNDLPDSFLPSLIQERVEGLFEIRSFFFNERFFSMAIFSENYDDTVVDYRDYSNVSNVYVPYSLPLKVEKDIKKLISEIGLNTCSIDLILDKNMNYKLLEVNVEGQFNWVSYECNYYIERYIALTLLDETK